MQRPPIHLLMGLWTEYILVHGYISSLQSAETGRDTCHTEILTITTTTRSTPKSLCQELMGASGPQRQVRGHLQSAVTHWMARWLQVQASLEKRKENTVTSDGGGGISPLTHVSDSQTDRCHATQVVLIWSVTYKVEEHYQTAGLGLQLWALWNRNHMRGVFRSIKTNTQRLNRN